MLTVPAILGVVLYVLGTAAVLLTLLPLLRHGGWWVRIGDFPRLQLAAVCILSALILTAAGRPLGTGESLFIILLVLCAAYQVYRFLPYLPFYPRQVEGSRVPLPGKIIRLLIFNIFIENRRYGRFEKLVRKYDPDIILLAEPDAAWLEAIAGCVTRFPHCVEHPLGNSYGMALYSKLELIGPRIEFLVEDDIPSIHTGVRLRSGDEVTLICLHPRPPVPPENDRSHERDAELLLVGKALADRQEPIIVAGDLNDVAWSRTTQLFQKISGLLDPRVGRGLYNSFHSKYPLIRFPLDHVFHSKHFRLVELRRLPHVGSDHFPIYVSLSYERTAEMTQSEPPVGEADQREAEMILEEALEAIGSDREAAGGGLQPEAAK